MKWWLRVLAAAGGKAQLGGPIQGTHIKTHAMQFVQCCCISTWLGAACLQQRPAIRACSSAVVHLFVDNFFTLTSVWRCCTALCCAVLCCAFLCCAQAELQLQLQSLALQAALQAQQQ